jgi:hypothetical protein
VGLSQKLCVRKREAKTEHPPAAVGRLRSDSAPLHRTFPIVSGDSKGCFTALSENILCQLTFNGCSHGYRRSAAQTKVTMLDIRAVGSLVARTQRSTITRVTAFLALILIPSLSSATIYKCTAQDGSITYTDTPCPEDTTTQNIDPAAPPWLNESSETMNPTEALTDGKSQSPPEILANLCANDEFKVWLKAQRHSLPERDTRTAKFIRLSYLCRRALHLRDVGAPISPLPLKRVLGQQMPRGPILSRN